MLYALCLHGRLSGLTLASLCCVPHSGSSSSCLVLCVQKPTGQKASSRQKGGTQGAQKRTSRRLSSTMGLTRLSSEGTPAAPCLSLASFARAAHSRLPGRRFCGQALVTVRIEIAVCTYPDLACQADHARLGSDHFHSVIVAAITQHGSFHGAISCKGGDSALLACTSSLCSVSALLSAAISFDILCPRFRFASFLLHAQQLTPHTQYRTLYARPSVSSGKQCQSCMRCMDVYDCLCLVRAAK